MYNNEFYGWKNCHIMNEYDEMKMKHCEKKFFFSNKNATLNQCQTLYKNTKLQSNNHTKKNKLLKLDGLLSEKLIL